MAYKDLAKKRAYELRYRATHGKQKRERAARYRVAHYDEVQTRAARYRADHREKIRERMADYRAANPERERETLMRYRASHRDELVARTSRYRMAQPDKVREARSRYSAAHQDKIREGRARYYARKLSAPRNDLTHTQWEMTKAHYGYRCVYCQRKMQRLTMDHIEPLSKGGSHTVQNVVPACRSCNSRKNAGPPLTPVQPLLLAV